MQTALGPLSYASVQPMSDLQFNLLIEMDGRRPDFRVVGYLRSD